MDFPQDAVGSWFIPGLIVLDPTPNPKLTDLSKAFAGAGGVMHTQVTMLGRTFKAWLVTRWHTGLGNVRTLSPWMPCSIQLQADLPDRTLSMQADAVVFNVGTVDYSVPREPTAEADESE